MFATAKGGTFSVTAYLGDGSVLLAFDMAEQNLDSLAGFSIQCTTPDKGPYSSNQYWLTNLLTFQDATPGQRPDASKPVGSNLAPFQTFHWMHFPSAGPGQYKYTVYASYFKSGKPSLGPSVTLPVDLQYRSFPGLEVGFTRGYVSSQAYADRFGNKPIFPTPKRMDYDTTNYQEQYQWLGAHARQLVFGFLQECKNDPSVSLDMFAFDFDEPDVIRQVAELGTRVRLYQDDSKEHTGGKAVEPETVSYLQKAGVLVKTGHFERFAHDKVMIQKEGGGAFKVLTGSANFSARGLYVQANSVLTIDDPKVAGLYEQAFQQAFDSASGFARSPVASQWYGVSSPGLPAISLSFAPHATPFSLTMVADAISAAKSSVFFAIMQMGGAGPVMKVLEDLGQNNLIYAIGTIQDEAQLRLFRHGMDPNVGFTSFAYLQKNVASPFKEEISGGPGQVIHHKFVVCDFNGKSPVVFCGSSNLSSGGETSNGDNLIAISDPEIATLYAVEAIRLFDHYNFRRLQQHSTESSPAALHEDDSWTKPFFDKTTVKFTERQVLSSPEATQ